MSQPFFDGVSALFQDASQVTCVVRASTARRIARFCGLSLALIVDIGCAFTIVMAHMRRTEVMAAGAMTPEQSHTFTSMRNTGYVLTGLVTLGVLLYGLEVGRRWGLRRSVLDLQARTLSDANGTRLTALDGIEIRTRPYKTSLPLKILGFMLALGLCLAALAGGSGDISGGGDGRVEVYASWPGGERVLSEPCTLAEATALCAKLNEIIAQTGVST